MQQKQPSSSNGGGRPSGTGWHWWGYEESLIFVVASWAVDVGALNDTHALLEYFDTPYKHPELFEAWCDSSPTGRTL